MSRLLIRNGTIVSPEGICREDLLIDGKNIIHKGTIDPGEFPDASIIDAAGKLIFPGGIDPHVHMALPTPTGCSSDDFRSGSQAALAGGTTALIDFVTPHRGQSLIEALHLRQIEAKKSLVDTRIHMGISEWNPKVATEVIQCIEKEGIRSFKAYLAYRETIGISGAQLRELMQVVGPAGGLVMVHCEEGEIIGRLQKELIADGRTRPCYHPLSRPADAEIRAVKKVIELSEKTRCPVYIVHVSTGGAVEAIRKAKKAGLPVFAETCPQYLVLDDSVYDPQLEDHKVLPYILSPPIRSKTDQESLWKGLADGTFETVATDHCPFNLDGQKDRGVNDFTKIPNGAGGVEHRLSLLYTYGVLTGRITINRFVSLASAKSAEIFGLSKKGRLDSGYDADVVIWDPEYGGRISAQTHFQHCDSDIYEGFVIRGRPEIVISAGKMFDPSGIANERIAGSSNNL
jgi:dihydropyrimidinase